MRWIIATLIASTLSTWLAVDHAGQPFVGEEPPAVEPLWLAQADASQPPPDRPPPDPPPLEDRPDLLADDPPGEAGRGGEFRPRGFGGRQQRGEPGPPDRPFTPDEQRKLMEILQRHFPRLHEHLEDLRRTQPVAYHHALQRIRRPLVEIMHAIKDDPTLASKLVEALQVEMELHELRRQYHEAQTDGQRESIRDAMRVQLGKRFDMRFERLKLEIQLLERRLDDMKRQLQDKDKDKARIVGDELERLLAGPPHEPPPRPRWGLRKGQPPPPSDR